MLLSLPLLHAHAVHPTTALVPYHVTGRRLQVVPIEHLVDDAVEDAPHHHYSSAWAVCTCRRYRLRFRAVFPRNVPLPAAGAYPAHSRCRPLSVHNLDQLV